MNEQDILNQPVASLTGIGRQTAVKLEKLGIYKIQDLLFHLPLRYEDRTRIYPLGSTSPGMNVLVCGRIELTDVLSHGRNSLVCRISDGTGFLTLRFFHFSAKQRMTLEAGTLISCFGEIREGFAGAEMIHPEYRIITSKEACVKETCLTPVYPLTEGLRQSTIRKAAKQALELSRNTENALIDWLPANLTAELNLPGLFEAIHTLHAPDDQISVDNLQDGSLPALKRLVFEEFLAHHLSLKLTRSQSRAFQAPVLEPDPEIIHLFLASLPFTLTGAQRRVIHEVETDCGMNKPMMRLLQGDVGSGKTIVAAYAALLAFNSGYQVAVMAPTELLAEQHYRNFISWFSSLPVKVDFLTGQLKGKSRIETLEALENGTTGILVGTHALFQESVIFSRLGLVIIDEQHRFGVHQRLALKEKGRQTQIKPHQLVMTATPIPRTLAMLNYSDLDLSIIDELPPGRTPVETSVIPSDRRNEVIDRIQGWIEQGRQAYWVCTLIEESEALQCEAAEKTLETLSLALPDTRVALVHGRMKPTEKNEAMMAFKRHNADLLVATTVIEVGVDVPNAGLMIIENPERLGLSQLHQLRGRVGRGPGSSYCLLMYQKPLSEAARQRLGILRETSDGFLIAEKDLELRGPGEVMGTRQTGQMQFKIADLARDSDLIPSVHDAAEFIETETPQAVRPLIQRWLRETAEYAEV